jgi:serine/threonine protein kinase
MQGAPRTHTSLPERLGSYELVRLVASGGMADIYLGRRFGIGQFERHVAIKVLNAARSVDPEARALFLDEARLLAMMSHANLASVFEVDVDDGVHYLAMEYVHGADLREVVAAASRAGREIPFEAALAVITAAAAGLDHAHRRTGPDGEPLHLVHRDVSLSNIMVGHDGSVKVVDFGIASATLSSVETQPGVVRGKASYMSPEQCLGDPVDLRTDVFALGIVLYELTTGRRCFQGGSDFERMLAVVRGDYVPPAVLVPDFPPLLDAVIKRAVAPEAEQRYPSCAEMIADLELTAQHMSWNLGTQTISRLMRELFGERAEPWTHLAPLDEDDAGPTEPSQPAVPAEYIEREHEERVERTVVITRPRRFPRGTEGAAAISVEDDAPTRGRRSVPRIWQIAA